MSQLGQNLPSRDFCGTAALPLKPDIGWRGWHGRKVPILLQKSFCTGDQKFSGLWARLSCKDVGDLIA
jgi:hypothetical protein